MDSEDQIRLAALLRHLRDGEALERSERAWVDKASTRTLHRLRGFCAHRVSTPERAEDAAQEAWAAMLFKIEQYEPKRGELESWLFGFARKTCAAQERQRVHAVFEDEVLDPETELGGVYRVLKHRIREQVLRQATAGLDEDQQVLLIMRYARDLPVRVLAEAMDMPVTTVEYRLKVLKARYRAAIAEELRKAQLGTSLFRTTI